MVKHRSSAGAVVLSNPLIQKEMVNICLVGENLYLSQFSCSWRCASYSAQICDYLLYTCILL